VKLTAHLHQASRLRKRGDIPPLLHTSLWRVTYVSIEITLLFYLYLINTYEILQQASDLNRLFGHLGDLGAGERIILKSILKRNVIVDWIHMALNRFRRRALVDTMKVRIL
jgi:hypothetical protein